MNVMTKIRPTTNRSSTVTTENIVITPDIAASWLEKNTHNRNVKPTVVNKYASDMRKGNWKFTGDAIRFSSDRVLLDGQHRLLACIKADTPFEAIVVYGLDAGLQDVIDTGKSRTATDVLTLRGVTNANRVSPSIRVLIGYRNELTNVARESNISITDITEALDQHPFICRSVAKLGGIPRGAPLAAIGFVHYVATMPMFLDKGQKADDMIAVWKTGVPTYHGDVMHALRERLLRDDTRYHSHHLVWTLFYAWNLFVEGETTGVLRIQKSPVDLDGLERHKL